MIECGLFLEPENDADRAELERRRVEYEREREEERKRWHAEAQQEQEREAKIAAIDQFLEPMLRESIVEEIEGRRIGEPQRKAYAAEFKRFREFCARFDLTALPCHPLVLAAHLVDQFNRPTAELEQIVEAVGLVHKLADEADPTTDPAVAAVMRLSRIHGEHEKSNRKELD